MEDDIKRGTAKRKTALSWPSFRARRPFRRPAGRSTRTLRGGAVVDDGKRGMANALRTKPLEVKEPYEKQRRELQEADGEGMLGLRARKKADLPAGQRGRDMILCLQQGLAEDGFKVRRVKRCQWFEIPRRTVYGRSTKAARKV
jgi:hypothetical protein